MAKRAREHVQQGRERRRTCRGGGAEEAAAGVAGEVSRGKRRAGAAEVREVPAPATVPVAGCKRQRWAGDGSMERHAVSVTWVTDREWGEAEHAHKRGRYTAVSERVWCRVEPWRDKGVT